MAELGDLLKKLGLSQYLEPFVEEGFDTWPTLMDITESDLDALGVKLGHRRKLQRYIAESRKEDPDRVPLEILRASGSRDETVRSGDESIVHNKTQRQNGQNAGSNQAQPDAKRKYRRHPKPDEFAPERPPSAYVIFSNLMREKLRGQELSFTEIAKTVGERWQELSQKDKEPCEKEAQMLKERYYANLAEYKKTPQYVQYQVYLAEFRAKHNQDGSKRTKLDLENRSTRSNSHDYSDRANLRCSDSRWSFGRVDREQMSSSPAGRPQHRPNLSDSASPGKPGPQAQSPLNRKESASPNSPNIAPFRPYLHPVDYESSGWRSDGGMEKRTLPFQPHGAPYPPTLDHRGPASPNVAVSRPGGLHPASRRTTNTSESVPSLVRDETVGSDTSMDRQSTGCGTTPSYLLPPIETLKATPSRGLPMLSSPGGPALLNPISAPVYLAQPPISNIQEPRSRTSLATLLRATEHLAHELEQYPPPSTRSI